MKSLKGADLDIGGQIYTKQQLRAKCKQYPGGLYFFAKAVLGFDRLKKHLHLPMANFVQMHPWNTGQEVSNRKLLWMPREHFKSTICSVAFPLWLLSCVDRNLTIALISAHSDNTIKWLRQIRNIIQFNGAFRGLFPHIRPGGKWDETEIVVSRDQNLSGDAQASITAYSINSGLASQHHKYLILDDAVNEQVSKSDVEMSKAVDLFHLLDEVLRGWKESGFLAVGTPWGREDVIQAALEQEQRGTRLKWGIGALGEFTCSDSITGRDEIRPNVEEGEPILPSECGWDKLKEKKSQNVEQYYLNYLCKPFDAGRNGFHLELMRPFAMYPDGTLKCDCHPEHAHHLAQGSTIAVSDPAYTKDKDGCETSIQIGNKQPCDCRFLLHEYGGHIHPSEYIPHAAFTANEWKTWLKAWFVEDEALQITLRQWLEEAQASGKFPLGVVIQGLKVRNRSKDGRIASAQTPVNNGWWHILPTMQLIEGRNNTIHQIFQWPYSRKRDRADGFSYFDEAWEEFPVVGKNPSRESYGVNARREKADVEQMTREDW